MSSSRISAVGTLSVEQEYIQAAQNDDFARVLEIARAHRGEFELNIILSKPEDNQWTLAASLIMDGEDAILDQLCELGLTLNRTGAPNEKVCTALHAASLEQNSDYVDKCLAALVVDPSADVKAYVNNEARFFPSSVAAASPLALCLVGHDNSENAKQTVSKLYAHGADPYCYITHIDGSQHTPFFFDDKDKNEEFFIQFVALLRNDEVKLKQYLQAKFPFLYKDKWYQVRPMDESLLLLVGEVKEPEQNPALGQLLFSVEMIPHDNERPWLRLQKLYRSLWCSDSLDDDLESGPADPELDWKKKYKKAREEAADEHKLFQELLSATKRQDERSGVGVLEICPIPYLTSLVSVYPVVKRNTIQSQMKLCEYFIAAEEPSKPANINPAPAQYNTSMRKDMQPFFGPMSGDTPLTYAARLNNLTVIDVAHLCHHSELYATVNFGPFLGLPPLAIAILEGHHNVAFAILQYTINVRKCPLVFFTKPLDGVMRGGRLIDLIKQHANPRCKKLFADYERAQVNTSLEDQLAQYVFLPYFNDHISRAQSKIAFNAYRELCSQVSNKGNMVTLLIRQLCDKGREILEEFANTPQQAAFEAEMAATSFREEIGKISSAIASHQPPDLRLPQMSGENFMVRFTETEVILKALMYELSQYEKTVKKYFKVQMLAEKNARNATNLVGEVAAPLVKATAVPKQKMQSSSQWFTPVESVKSVEKADIAATSSTVRHIETDPIETFRAELVWVKERVKTRYKSLAITTDESLNKSYNMLQNWAAIAVDKAACSDETKKLNAAEKAFNALCKKLERDAAEKAFHINSKKLERKQQQPAVSYDDADNSAHTANSVASSTTSSSSDEEANANSEAVASTADVTVAKPSEPLYNPNRTDVMTYKPEKATEYEFQKKQKQGGGRKRNKEKANQTVPLGMFHAQLAQQQSSPAPLVVPNESDKRGQDLLKLCHDHLKVLRQLRSQFQAYCKQNGITGMQDAECVKYVSAIEGEALALYETLLVLQRDFPRLSIFNHLATASHFRNIAKYGYKQFIYSPDLVCFNEYIDLTLDVVANAVINRMLGRQISIIKQDRLAKELMALVSPEARTVEIETLNLRYSFFLDVLKQFRGKVSAEVAVNDGLARAQLFCLALLGSINKEASVHPSGQFIAPTAYTDALIAQVCSHPAGANFPEDIKTNKTTPFLTFLARAVTTPDGREHAADVIAKATENLAMMLYEIDVAKSHKIEDEWVNFTNSNRRMIELIVLITEKCLKVHAVRPVDSAILIKVTAFKDAQREKALLLLMAWRQWSQDPAFNKAALEHFFFVKLTQVTKFVLLDNKEAVMANIGMLLNYVGKTHRFECFANDFNLTAEQRVVLKDAHQLFVEINQMAAPVSALTLRR